MAKDGDGVVQTQHSAVIQRSLPALTAQTFEGGQPAGRRGGGWGAGTKGCRRSDGFSTPRKDVSHRCGPVNRAASVELAEREACAVMDTQSCFDSASRPSFTRPSRRSRKMHKNVATRHDSTRSEGTSEDTELASSRLMLFTHHEH